MDSERYSSFAPSVFVNVPEEGVEIDDIPFYGDILAGFPSPALDYDDEELDIEELLFGSYHSKVLFRVRGDSMCEAGIYEGDIAIVEKGVTAKIGDIVIAFVDGQYSIKYLQKDKQGTLYLRPANKEYKDIYPEEALKIFGVVSSIVRKYKNI